MLRVGDNLEKSEEFQKAGIMVKTIRVESNGSIKEHMSFPTFKFKEIVKESWEESTLKNFFECTKLFFAVFKKDAQGELFFKGTKFFSIPQSDIDGKIKTVWQDTVNKLNKGVVISNTSTSSSRIKVSNNFIKTSEKMITHIRPKARKSSYVESSDSYELPVRAKWEKKPYGYSDNWMTKHCF